MINTCTSEFVYDLRGLSSEAKPLKDSYKEAGLGHAPANGSMFFEMDTSKKYMYDEEHDTWLEWKSGGGGGGGDLPTYIVNPEKNQILVYDADRKSWVNIAPTDNISLVFLDNVGLSLKGYENATQGQMLVKDVDNGVVWVNPLDETELRAAVAQAEAAASQAGNYATQAGNSAIDADTAAKTAQRINEQTMAWVNEKFWWGTLEEYNALETVTEGTFYFITL